jgi:RNA polymerase sigma-70 factor (ECF subfamily)
MPTEVSARPHKTWELHIDSDLANALYARSGAAEYELTKDAFVAILQQVLARTEDSPRNIGGIRDFLSALRLDELALAHGCAAGNQRAWDVFLTKYRESIYQSARGVTRNESIGRELADSLYAELYGLGSGEERRSKLALYSGRGSLAGWLRMVLSQSYINRIRAEKRLVSIEEQEEEHGTQFAAPAPQPESAIDSRLREATDEALAQLASEERFLFTSYFLDGRKLAEIGRMLGVHESTISRKLEKALKEVRKRIRKGLERRGMSRRQADEALEADVRDLEMDVSGRLRPPGANSS